MENQQPDFEFIHPPASIITPLVLADPLAPGNYLGSVYKYKPGAWADGRLVLPRDLGTHKSRLQARQDANKMAVLMEEEDPLP